jgi:hypothetical protein
LFKKTFKGDIKEKKFRGLSSLTDSGKYGSLVHHFISTFEMEAK